MPEPKGPSEFVSDAYQLEGDAGMVEFYRKWAEDYDNQMEGIGYLSPTAVAGLLRQYLPDPASTVFDIGCGTGLTCVDLAARGYTNLDGIDLSPEMVRVARQRGIYRKLLVGDLNQPLELDEARYDGAISSGTFTHGHVGAEPLDEILRILRPGGILACTIHQDLWEPMGFKTKLASLVTQDRMRCLERRLDKYYQAGEPEGWFCVYQKIR